MQDGSMFTLNFLLYSLNGKQNNSGLQTLETPMSTSEKLSSVNRLKGDACTLHGVWLLEQSTFSQCERKNVEKQLQRTYGNFSKMRSRSGRFLWVSATCSRIFSCSNKLCSLAVRCSERETGKDRRSNIGCCKCGQLGWPTLVTSSSRWAYTFVHYS